MLDIGWSEMLVIVLVAIVVVGPRDLPGVLRTVGRWAGKARSLSREFQRNFSDLARETDFDEVKRSIRDTTNLGLSDKAPGTASGDKAAKAASSDKAPGTASDGKEARPASGDDEAPPAPNDQPRPVSPPAVGEGLESEKEANPVQASQVAADAEGPSAPLAAADTDLAAGPPTVDASVPAAEPAVRTEG
jgi:sec-independent protein translocase protein TatB